VSTSSARYFILFSIDRPLPLTLPNQFVEDEGDIVFYKNAQGLAAARPLVIDTNASDSGVDVQEKEN